MTVTAQEIFSEISNAAEAAFHDGWEAVKSYAPAEFRKMAVQLESISRNVGKYLVNPEDGYSPETGKLLFAMQRNACESVLVAVTHLILISIQKALNAIMNVLKTAFGGALAAFV